MFGNKHHFLVICFFLSFSIVEELSAQSTGDSLANIANDFFNNRSYEDAITFEKQSLTWFKENKHIEKQSNSLNNLGLYFYLLGKYDSSLHYYNQSLQIDLTLKKPRRIITRYNNLGITYKKMGNYVMALDFYLKALQLSNESNESSKLGTIYLSIANLLLLQSRPEEATNYLNKASQEFLVRNDSSGYVKSINNLGSAHFRVPNYDSALYFYRAALNLKRVISTKEFLGSTLQNVGETYFALNQLDSAEFYFLEAIRSKELEGNKQSLSLTMLNLVKVLLRKKQLRKADEYLIQVTSYLGEIKSANIEVLYYQNRNQYYEIINDKDSALYFYKKWNNLQDSLFQVEKIKVLDQLNMYEKNLLQSEKDSALQQVQLQNIVNRQQQITIIVFVIALFLSICILFLIYSSRKKEQNQNMQLEEKNSAIESLNNRLKILLDDIKHRKQNDFNRLIGMIESVETQHDNLSSSLDPVYNMIFANADIDNYLYTVSNQHRIDLRPYVLSLCERLDALHNFKARKIQFQHYIDPIKTTSKHGSAIAFIICELVNNSIKHGLPKGSNTSIILKVSVEDNKILFSYSDNGNNESYVQDLQRSSGKGWSIIKRLLASLDSQPELLRMNGRSIFNFKLEKNET